MKQAFQDIRTAFAQRNPDALERALSIVERTQEIREREVERLRSELRQSQAKPRRVAQDGWYLDGTTRVPRLAAVPFRMSPECQYTQSELGQADPKCAGCRHRTDNPKE